MSIEFQIRSSALAGIITRSLQDHLRMACFPEFAGFFIDHADVVPATPGFSPVDGAVHIRVPVEIFVVSRAAVLAAPNGLPDGAANPMGVVDLIIELKVNGTDLALRCVDVVANLPVPVPPGLKQAICSSHQIPPFQLRRVFEMLKLPAPAASTVELAGETVCVRFDPSGGPVGRLFPDQEWGLFIDGPAVGQLALSFVPNTLSFAFLSLRMTPHWRPNGLTAHVDIDYEGAAQLPDPFTARGNGTFACDINLIPTPAQMLRANVGWTIQVNLGEFMPAFVDKMVKDLAAAVLNPQKFGGTPTGPRSFFVERRLPDIEFSGSRLTYTSAKASPAGMTIGGAVHFVLVPGRETIAAGPTPFSTPGYSIMASEYGCTFGLPSDEFIAARIKVYASISMGDYGKICGFEIVSPGDWIRRYTAFNEWHTGSGTLNIVIPGLIGLQIHEPVRILVHTSRGVRLFNLGRPNIQVDEEGNILNVDGVIIDDCLYMTIWDWYWATQPTDPITGKPLPPPPAPWPPPEWIEFNQEWLTIPPDADLWNRYLENLESLDLQLVTITGLEPNELIQFRSIEHAADILADQNGRAMVPVMLAHRHRLEPARLTRVNRKNFSGNITVRTALFERHSQLEGGLRNQIATTADGATYVIAEAEDGTFAYQPGMFGSWTRLEAPDTPLAEPTSQGSSAAYADLPGLVSLMRMPGFEDEPVAFAAMDDDSVLVLDLYEPGQARVAGIFRGPIGEIAMLEDWGITSARNRITAFKVTRSESFTGPPKKVLSFPKL